MRRVLLFIIICCTGIGFANAAVRDGTAISRAATTQQPTVNRTTAAQSRQSTHGIQSRNARTASVPQLSARATTNAVTRNPNNYSRSANTITRSSQKTSTTTHISSRPNIARATLFDTPPQTETFGTGYISCRDAYFTCMDQFCAKQDDSYRRCICSSRLAEIKSRERALKQAADSLETFSDLNLDVITKTKGEVTAMMTASDGESAIKKDTSNAAKQLAGISDVLSKTKKQALSTQGTLDIAGDINAIWATTELTSGGNISNLTGEALYNAVHAQCAEIMTQYCPTPATQTMVISAYGMYIENDCSNLINGLDKKLVTANNTIRDTERKMHLERLENYNNHNDTSINDCVANVRTDITADTACGTDYVHCLDVSGRYLNRTTGEPIYTADFYQLESQISLSGDILNNQSNRMIVAELQRMRKYAEHSLNSCSELADDVWDEFMRQAIREIYQGQHERIRNVKENCLDVVNKCYDEQNQSLKDFSNVKDQLLIGQRLELSEEMCKEKLNACSNLYGNITLLVQAMHDIVNQQIAKECRPTLEDYVKDLCAVTNTDTVHIYPYACRTYTPGSQRYATISNGLCNINLTVEDGDDAPKTRAPSLDPETGEEYLRNLDCGDYTGSLYQKLVRYALNACVRPSQAENLMLPTTVLEDVNVVMDQIRVDMAKSLSTECERLGGLWVSVVYNPNDTEIKYQKHKKFYDDTGANTQWGICTEPDPEDETKPATAEQPEQPEQPEQ